MAHQSVKEWKILNECTKKDFPEIYQPDNFLHPKLLKVLYSRGIDTPKKLSLFLNGGLEDLASPFLFEQMQTAVDRIRRAIDNEEFILVYGDRDVDGITAVNIVVDTIRKLGGLVVWYVPSSEGYGIHKDILSQYASNDIKVLITVDCGICAKEEIEYAKSLGMDVILTDHHEPVEDAFPKPFACLDPKVKDSRYPFKDLAGCGVALKLSWALIMSYEKQYAKQNLLFIASGDGQDFSGKLLWLYNDVEISRKDFQDLADLKAEIKNAYRVYTSSKECAQALISRDVLLKDKIIIFDEEADTLEKILSLKLKRDFAAQPYYDFFNENLDICALGTIADSMPLLDENRIIVKEGLKVLAKFPNARPGLGLLIEDTLKTKTSYNITAKSISWLVTPVLNSAGRMGRGSLSAQLLMARDKFQAQTLYTDIIKLNAERKWLQLENIWQFKSLLKQQCDIEKDKVLIVQA
ncbi:MAG: DHH family phosphoesterase, partial [Elusimicrobiota bacterium]|nr:DHH family phosphoesterase [Elusimicrobiota bacterium]